MWCEMHRACPGVAPPGHHLKDLVIYETHVRGFTRTLGPNLTAKDVAQRDWLFACSLHLIQESRQQAARLGLHSWYIPRQDLQNGSVMR